MPNPHSSRPIILPLFEMKNCPVAGRCALIVACILLMFSRTCWADDVASTPLGKGITVVGDIAHFKTPDGVKVDGASSDGAYDEEVFAPTMTVRVAGLPAGTYTIEVDLAEIYRRGSNQRVMSIVSGDTVLAEKLDIFAEVGFAKAYKLEAKVDHKDDAISGPLSITFKSIVDQAKFNAIHILDSKGQIAASVKAGDLISVADAAAKVIPAVSDPIIYTDPDKPQDARIDDLIRRMSLFEKIQQIMNDAPSIPRLNVPQYNYWNECLHGVAYKGNATVFPQAIGMAAAWDVDKLHQVAEAIAIEGRAKYNQGQRDGSTGHGLTFWAPNINIFRDPRWGRGQETYGEDPYLTARCGVNFIEGIQGEQGGYLEAMACAKHFAVHSGPEPGRGGFNAEPETRDLYETYLPQFQAVVEEAHVGAVMSSYNAVHHIPMSANKEMLTDLLRHKWGFTGHVVSDCEAVRNIVSDHHYANSEAEGDADAINAGLDLECGESFAHLTEAVGKGLVTEKQIDTALHYTLAARFRLGMFDPPARVPWSNVAMTEVESPDHLALARSMARESLVLLKNEHVLPLNKTTLRHIVVLGVNADASLRGDYSGDPSHPISVLQGIKNEVGDAVKVDYFKGAPLVHRDDHADEDVSADDYQKALAGAAAADVIIYVGGLTAEMEGEENGYSAPGFDRGDRTRIELPEVQDKLLHDLNATGKPVIFVNCTGSALGMPWEAANLPAILQVWYPGSEAGSAVADVLFGNYNPSGRLPITFYEKTSDLPDYTDYRMANRTYRYFTGKVLFPFGFGLSYTKFDYLPITCPATTLIAKDSLHLSVPIKNTGSLDGDEIVQVYLKHLNPKETQPIRSLIGFKRLPVVKGATASAEFDIPVERFHYWSVEKNAYVVDAGDYEIEVGASSQDIRQKQIVKVQ